MGEQRSNPLAWSLPYFSAMLAQFWPCLYSYTKSGHGSGVGTSQGLAQWAVCVQPSGTEG